MYLSEIYITNFRAIEILKVNLNPNINIIVGENSAGKSSLIDAIRLLYSFGKQQKDIFIRPEDFRNPNSPIEFVYRFNVSAKDKGALYQFLVIQHGMEDSGQVVFRYTLDKKRRVNFTYVTGASESTKADVSAFQQFTSYYMSALRDSTRDMLNSKGSILGKLVLRNLERNNKKDEFEKIMQEANKNLLQQSEIQASQKSINTNIEKIFAKSARNKIGLVIEDSKAENIVNVIKPYLPIDKNTLQGEGLNLYQNSLGYNNIIYIATVLGDIQDQLNDAESDITHCALLIEEPEAHLHPQLQLSLFNFLNDANSNERSQLFVTTHSPTLTSKVPLSNLILLLHGKFSFNIGMLFEGNEAIDIEWEDDDGETEKRNVKSAVLKSQLERYLDVTRSQLFFAKGVVFVEGISEELLMPVFSKILKFDYEHYGIELVNVDGTSFYPFVHLLNKINKTENLIPFTIFTDDDRYAKGKYISFKALITSTQAIKDYQDNLKSGQPVSRIETLTNLIKDTKGAMLSASFQTFEFELIKANIPAVTKDFETNFLLRFLSEYSISKTKYKKITALFTQDQLSSDDIEQISILLWKSIPNKHKATFAQDLAGYFKNNFVPEKDILIVPDYIKQGLSNLVNAIS